jgi:hypothetical protein
MVRCAPRKSFAWRARTIDHRATIERAADYFQASRGIPSMGGHVLRLNSGEAIVRIMYAAGGVPPARAWFAVSVDGKAIRELFYEDVATLETPWR